MSETSPQPARKFLGTRAEQSVSVLLFAQLLIFYCAPTKEHIPNPPPLAKIATTLGDWRMTQESPIDSETQRFLKADDTLSRSYAGPSGSVGLFIAFFKSQRAGVTPHSPKVCLPGAGWTPEASRIISVPLPGESRQIAVNRFTVSHGLDRSLVFYWYQTPHYVVADEYLSKLYLMYSGLRYRRSDESIVRVIVPIAGNDEENAQKLAVSFIQTVFPPLRQQMWQE